MALTRLLGRPGRFPSDSQNLPLSPVAAISFFVFSFNKVLFSRLTLWQSFFEVEEADGILLPSRLGFEARDDVVAVLVGDLEDGAFGTELKEPKESSTMAESEPMNRDNDMLS